MNFLLFHLKRLLMLPVHLVTSPSEVIGSLWSESARSRALLLGLPAILFAVIGVGILLWAKFGIADSLESSYLAQLEDSSEEKKRLLVDLRRELRMLQASKQAGTENSSSPALIPDDDPRRVELQSLSNRERIYLEKLIDLNPQESEYLYQLAIVAYEQRDVSRCLALMNLVAPFDEPGYIKGHLWLANFYAKSRVKTRREMSQNVSRALIHVDQCLKRDSKNIDAKRIKATLLYMYNRDLNEAYEIFLDLFKKNPRDYKALVDINKQLKRTERTEEVLDSAINRFNEQLRTGAFDVAEEIQIWRDLITCYIQKKEFSNAEQRLLEEIKRQSQMQENRGSVWAERMLSNVYLAWSGSIARGQVDSERERMAYLKKAYRYNANQPNVLRELTRLAASKDPEVAKESVSIYDAMADPDAPASVSNEIGSQALARAEYASAIRYFEMARKKAPRDPEILNNLAYTYIVCEDPNPKRGLTLVDEALRRLPNSIESKNYLTFFRDTRGQALMQLSRWTEAAADFEFALRDRPDNQKILESLVKCYRASGLDPGAYVERLRVAKESDSANTPDPDAQTPGQ